MPSATSAGGSTTTAGGTSLPLYDKGDINGTELRAFAGNFLYSAGANEVAGRFAVGHFDLPMRNCTIDPRRLGRHHGLDAGSAASS